MESELIGMKRILLYLIVMLLAFHGEMLKADNFSFGDIREFRLVKDDDAVKGLSADLSGLRLDHGRIYLNQVSAVSVFSLKGQRVEVPASVQDRLTVLDVSALPAGVYVIKTDRTSFKFVKK